MENKEKSIFREASLERIKSPDELTDYVRVTNPRLWVLLAALLILLVGTCVWGIFGRMETKVQGIAQCFGGKLVCAVKENDFEGIKEGTVIRVSDKEGTVTGVTLFETTLGAMSAKHGLVLDNKDDADIRVREFEAELNIPDGFYWIEVITESRAPFSFLYQ